LATTCRSAQLVPAARAGSRNQRLSRLIAYIADTHHSSSSAASAPSRMPTTGTTAPASISARGPRRLGRGGTAPSLVAGHGRLCRCLPCASLRRVHRLAPAAVDLLATRASPSQPFSPVLRRRIRAATSASMRAAGCAVTPHGRHAPPRPLPGRRILAGRPEARSPW
jgi:hypothetical protein